MSAVESLSLEETNKVRLSLGLKPLGDSSNGDASAAAPAKTEDEIAVENFRAQRDAEDSAKNNAALALRLDTAKTKRDLRAKLSGRKGLGEAAADEDVAGAAKDWVKKSKRRAKEIAAELARKKDEELQAMDAELAARYDERDLAGLRVAHEADEFKEGEENILTLKDSRLIGADEGSDDELENVNMAEYKRTDTRLDLKKKGKNVNQYTGLDDEEFSTGKKAGILSKYDADIKDGSIDPSSSTGFRLGVGRGDSTRDEDDEANTFEAVSRPVDRSAESRQELAKELNKTLMDLNYDKNVATSDYLQEGDAGFKKLKKKKKPKTTSSRRTLVEGEDGEDSNMQLDAPNRTSQAELEAQALLDDEELQASLARQRRLKSRKAIVELKNRALLNTDGIENGMDLDGNVSPGLPVKEEDVEDNTTGLVLDDTSEFVRGITLQPALPPKREKSSGTPLPPQPSSSTLPGVPKREDVGSITELTVESNGMDVDDLEEGEEDARILSGDVKKEEDETDAILEGTSGGELLVSRGIGATLALLKQQGLVKPMSEEEMKAEREYKEKQKWLAKRREDEARIIAARQASKAAGSSKDQHQRELENRQREKEQATRDLDRFKNYKPNIDIKYTDEFGREMTKKEAWKDLSHRFHGKGSGTMKMEKRLKKIEDEKKAAAMASGDTPLSTNAAFQARQEKLGSATMLLSVGNRMTAPQIEDFQTSAVLDPSKAQPKGNKKGKGKAGNTPAPEINLTPTLDAPTQGSMVPRKAAGFKPITKRNIEDLGQDGDEANKRRRDD